MSSSKHPSTYRPKARPTARPWARIDLEQQRKRAKELLRAHRRGDLAAAERIQRQLPRAGRLPAAQVVQLALQLADAQLVIAREAGFATWPRMKHHIARAGLPDDGGAVPLHDAVRAGDAASVRGLLEGSAQRWHTREAIELAVERGDRAIAQLLLAHGAWVDFAGRQWGRGGSALHSALLLGRGAAWIELLLDGGASIAARDRDGRTALAVAVRTADDDAAARLRGRGAHDSEVSSLDRALGACVRGVPRAPWDGPLRPSDHQHMCWVIRTARVDAAPAVSALLGLGLDPNVADDDGETALHLAVAARALAVLRALLAAGARIDATNYRNETALTCAWRLPDDAERTALIDSLREAGGNASAAPDVAELFEDAVDAIVDGDLPRLRGMLDREPALVRARSLRPHRATLLHYVGSNGIDRQAASPSTPAIAALLLARGADPNALAYTYGGGPGQTTLFLACTSIHPEHAGVMAELLRALLRGGATLDDYDRGVFRAARRSALPVLLEAGVRIDLWFAATLGRLDDVRRLVAPDGTLAPGAAVGSDAGESAQRIKDSAFHQACGAGHTACAAYLHAAGADVAASDPIERISALQQAGRNGHVETVQFLIDHGAPLEAKNDYGAAALSFLLWVTRNQWRPGVDYAGVIERLLAAGADRSEVQGVVTGRSDVDAVLRRYGVC